MHFFWPHAETHFFGRTQSNKRSRDFYYLEVIEGAEIGVTSEDGKTALTTHGEGWENQSYNP